MNLIFVLIFLVPALLLSTIRQRYSREASQLPHLVQVEEEHPIETVPVPFFPIQRTKGGFLGFLCFLVVFFLILSLTVSNNFFVSSLLTKASETISNSPLFCEPPIGSELIGAYGGNITNYDFKMSSSTSTLTKMLFIQGMLHLFGFNQRESIRNFQTALEFDKNCAICYWGIAAASNSNINDLITSDKYQVGYTAIHKAVELLQTKSFQPTDNNNNCPNKEHLLIKSMASRFSLSPSDWGKSTSQVREELERVYSSELEEISRQCVDDPDIVSLYAESLLNLSPWQYFLPQSQADIEKKNIVDYPSPRHLNENSLKAFTILHKLLFQSSQPTQATQPQQFQQHRHPLALHLYIHLTEQFYSPHNSQHSLPVTAANLLFNQSLTTDSIGHLLHMPSHIFYRVGLFDRCVASSQKAVENDKFYQSKCFEPYFMTHNIALWVMCGMAKGDLNVSLSSTIAESSLDLTYLDLKFMTSMVPWPKDIIYTRFGQWSHLQSLQQSRKSNPTNSFLSSQSYSVSLHLYTKCLTDISLSYPLKEDELSSNLASLQHQQCLKELQQTVQLIPQDKKSKSHYFYPYHQEIGSLLVDIVTASSHLYSARQSSLQFNLLSPSSSSSSFYQISSKILQSYEQSLTSILQSTTSQESFHYMEPEIFYFPLVDCYFPLLFEIQTLLTFLDNYLSLLSSKKENDQETTNELKQFTDIYNRMNDFMKKIVMKDLYENERRKRYSEKESVWYKKGKERYEMIQQRRLEFEIEWNRLKKEESENESEGEGRLKLLLSWFLNERKEWLLNDAVNSGDVVSGSCCELQFC